MRAAEVFTGSGFRFQVLVDRGLDLGCAEHAGRPLAWVHPALGSPSLREPHGIGWLRTFGGGLVSTCGLDHFGPPDPEGEGYGLHGRASHLPAENLRVRQEWRGDEYVLEIEGETPTPGRTPTRPEGPRGFWEARPAPGVREREPTALPAAPVKPTGEATVWGTETTAAKATTPCWVDSRAPARVVARIFLRLSDFILLTV